MRFNGHSELVGKHAFLSPSSYHWVNYTDEKMEARFIAAMSAQRGSDLHAFAHDAIRLGIKLPGTQKPLGPYVNDAIGYRMASEQPLFYSPNCFGTADTIGFRKNKLRIHDLKNGISQTSEKQLEVYAALFCLEYNFQPFDIEIELRIYQGVDIRIYDGDPDVVMHIMDRIRVFDRKINEMRMEALS